MAIEINEPLLLDPTTYQYDPAMAMSEWDWENKIEFKQLSTQLSLYDLERRILLRAIIRLFRLLPTTPISVRVVISFSREAQILYGLMSLGRVKNEYSGV